MNNRLRQMQKIYKMTTYKDIRLSCIIYILGRI